MSINIQPNGEYIAVKQNTDSEEMKTSGGLILPSTSKDGLEVGTVVAVGSGHRSEEGVVTPLTIKIGDKVMFPKWSAKNAKIQQEELLFIKESEIVATIKN